MSGRAVEARERRRRRSRRRRRRRRRIGMRRRRYVTALPAMGSGSLSNKQRRRT
jgi:hypothetical protein